MKLSVRMTPGVALLSSSGPVGGEGPVHALTKGGRQFRLPYLTPDALVMIRRMAIEDVRLPPDADQELGHLVSELYRAGLVSRRVWSADELLLAAEGGGRRGFQNQNPDVVQQGGFTLSRQTIMSIEADHLIFENPVTGGRVAVFDRELASMIVGGDYTSYGNQASIIVGELVKTGIVSDCSPMSVGEVVGAHNLWSPHELLFHSRSRRHRAALMGENFGRLSQATAHTPLELAAHQEEVPLPRASRQNCESASLARCLDERRSCRQYNEAKPITIQSLSNVLSATWGAAPYLRRYPSGGGIYELECLVSARCVEGIDSGVYLYRPSSHSFKRMGHEREAKILCQDAAVAMAGEATPQVTLTLIARFPDIYAKYSQIGYSLILKHVGIVMEAVSLVCTAEKLACCLLGTGSPDAVESVTGWNPVEASSVGEIAIGSLPT